MKIILHGIVNIAGMAKAAEQAMAYEADTRAINWADKPKEIGLRIDGKYYAARFNKASVSIWFNEE